MRVYAKLRSYEKLNQISLRLAGFYQKNCFIFKGHLDTVAEVGLPIWITELSVASNDIHARANALRDILTLYFSHPAVEGILLWGFWDGKLFTPEVALFNGPDVTVCCSGLSVVTTFFTSSIRISTTFF